MSPCESKLFLGTKVRQKTSELLFFLQEEILLQERSMFEEGGTSSSSTLKLQLIPKVFVVLSFDGLRLSLACYIYLILQKARDDPISLQVFLFVCSL